ncbi:hypothetical protein KFE98_05970 [bacterium SCSIO 12741]|nr:hypothetical protein KFE98_05970 [bacterium SCSIO 12741]
MKKIFFGMLILCMGLLTSCDKCKDKTCENGSSCDSDTGDCVCVCQNGGECSTADGSCACPTFYTGSTCSIAIRSNYTGSFSGSLGITPGALTYTREASVNVDGTDVTKLTVEMDISANPLVPQRETFNITINDATSSFTVETKSITDDQNRTYEYTGSGTISATELKMTLNGSGIFNGFKITRDLDYTGTK